MTGTERRSNCWSLVILQATQIRVDFRGRTATMLKTTCPNYLTGSANVFATLSSFATEWVCNLWPGAVEVFFSFGTAIFGTRGRLTILSRAG